MKKHGILLYILAVTVQFANAQLSLDGEFRPRTEYRNGFGTLIPEAADAGFGISTRLRLNAGYAAESYKFYMSLQDVLVWGENMQLLPYDQNNSFAIFEAWGELALGSGFSTKLGRQIISYDDERIFGGLDWAQQGRNHDAALIQYRKEKFMLDLGLAFSQDYSNPTGFVNSGTAYNTSGNFSYKTMQYLYAKQVWERLSGSVLFLNNGFQKFDTSVTPNVADGTSNLQTLGTHLEYKQGRLGLAANAYIQTGKREGDIAVKGAYLLGLDVNYKATDKVGLGAGIELISGNDKGAGETSAFFPLYGTNHKFNGFMDYFYVGNHANTVGLFDVHANANFTFSDTSSLLVKILNFRGEQALPSGEKSLGTEVDLVYTKKFKGYSMVLGYSHMFAADGMYELKRCYESGCFRYPKMGLGHAGFKT
jgi:hypothetical protein